MRVLNTVYVPWAGYFRVNQIALSTDFNLPLDFTVMFNHDISIQLEAQRRHIFFLM